MILYVNACVRTDSRTDRIARSLLDRLGDHEEIKLTDAGLLPLDEERLDRRTQLISEGKYDDPMFDHARQFAAADVIVMAAPFWDGSFPSVLKTYIENIYVTGIVSEYSDEGIPVGLCKAEKLYYVTTAGGPYMPEYSFGYIKTLAEKMFGIKETELIYAEGLDIIGNDSEEIVERVIKERIDGISGL